MASKSISMIVSCALICTFIGSTVRLAHAQTQQQGTPQQGTPPNTAPPAGTQTPNQTPTQTQTPTRPLPPGQTQLPPNSGTAPINPQNEAQQSTQPQTGIEQQRQQTAPSTNAPTPISPQVQPPSQQQNSGATQQTATPAGTAAPASGVTSTTGAAGAIGTGAAGQNVGISTGVAPAQLPTEPPAIAPGYEAPQRPLPTAERVGVDVTEQTPLSLNEAIALALQNNNDIDSARIDVRLAEFDLTAARGAYDPIIASENYYERRVTPTSSIIGGGANGSVTQNSAVGAFSFGGLSPYAGGSYQVDFSSSRLTTNNSFVSLNPQFPSSATVTYVQPLLRGRTFDNTRRVIQVARKNLSLTDSQFRGRAIEIITLVEQSYWDLAFALRNLQVQIDAVRQARTQVESNRRLVQQGVLAPIDLVAADAQVTTFEQSVYSAQESVTRAENNLKLRILPDRSAELWNRAIVPVTPVDLTPPTVELEGALTSAIQNRPEVAQLQTSAEINEINTRFFREQTRPQIDVVGTFNPVGLAGTAVPRVSNPLDGANSGASTSDIINRINELSARANTGLDPLLLPTPTTGSTLNPNLIGGYAQSVGNLFGLNYPTVRVGVRVSLPLRNRTAQAQLGRSLAEGTQLTNQRAQVEQLIELDVRNNLQAVRSAEARLASAASARNSAELQYASEQRQFAAGLSTLFLVLQRQQELIAARGRELQAQTDLNKSLADFRRAIGNTLEANNVSVIDEKEFRELRLRPEARQALAASPILNGIIPRTFNLPAKATPPASNSFAQLK